MRIIVTGLIAQHYTMGGVTWDYLQYLIGLKSLGHEVFYFEDSGEWPYNLDGGITGDDWVAKDCNSNITYLNKVLSRYDLHHNWAYYFPLNATWFGLPDVKRKEIIQTADLLINVSGTLEKPENYRSVKRLIYVDSDPGFTQVKLKGSQNDFTQRVNAHDVFFSFGECLPEDLTDENYNWKPTRTPIVLSEWQPTEPGKNAYTTVMNWTSYSPLQYEGNFLYQKDVEFIKFLTLTEHLKDIHFEVALSPLQHANWQSDVHPELLNKTPVELLSHFGWHVVDPAVTCADIDSYRRYIFNSKAEWSVAKGGYVVSGPGWFSCRSACYLAAGKPVIIQDTGFGKVLPVGEGILAFSTLAESIEAVLEVEAHYDRHAKRAQEIAYEYFDADKVLKSLIERMGEK